MNKHLKYLSYVLRHKYYVGKALLKLGGWRMWYRVLKHDWTKFMPSEWFPYVEYFNNPSDDHSERAIQRLNFDYAWLHHLRLNSHHRQYYMAQEDNGSITVLDMPYLDIVEMVADWKGAGLAQHNSHSVEEWYYEHTAVGEQLAPYTRQIVEELIKEV